MLFETKAQMLMAKATGKEGTEVQFDPAMILVGLELLKEIIALYRSCHRPAAMAAENMKSPGLVARRRLRKLIEARQLPEGVSVKAMHTAALEVGKTMTEEEVVEMYKAV